MTSGRWLTTTVSGLAGILLLPCSGAVGARDNYSIDAAGVATAFEANGFARPSIALWNMANLVRPVDREFDLTLVVLKGSNWSAEKVRKQLNDAVPVLASCGVGVATAVYVELQPREAEWLSSTQQHEAALARGTPTLLPRPVMFFTLENAGGKWAHAYSLDMCKGTTRCDTAWLTHDVFMKEYRAGYSGDNAAYTFTHELVHLLLQSNKHTTGDMNLMHDDPRKMAPILTSKQCSKIRTHPSVAR